MFGTSHPQPPQRKEVAMQIVRQERRSFAGAELTIDSPPSSDVAPPPDAPPIHFSVSYTLADYMSILGAHLGFVMRHAPYAESETAAPDLERLRAYTAGRGLKRPYFSGACTDATWPGCFGTWTQRPSTRRKSSVSK
ncbi:hypothetical protein ACI48D_09915 [Massilia sp. LXY-6]|uniref:hypothetical protein n=1 Tax=Massilia sp. LXY-6 TaxID=3379823 RepID=UPI003EE1CF87